MNSPRLYFRELSDLMLNTVVTEKGGTTISLEEGTDHAVNMILSIGSTLGKVMLVGNGGSAAIVSHMQNDLCKAAGVRAMLFTDPPLLTAISNDLGYAHVFERPVKLWANPGDLLLAISSSGQSQNILRAAQAAVTQGCKVITFSGFRADNELRSIGHLNFYVPSQGYGYVELVHSSLAHFLTDCAVKARSERESLDE